MTNPTEEPEDPAETSESNELGEAEEPKDLPHLLRNELEVAKKIVDRLAAALVSPNTSIGTGKADDLNRLRRDAGGAYARLETASGLAWLLAKQLANLQKELACLRESGVPTSAPPAVDISPLAKQLADLQKELASLRESSVPTSAPPSVDIAPLSVEARQRMSSMSDHLGVAQGEALERCIATQFYLDQKAREGWTVMLKRGRERRQVIISSPGSSIPASVNPGRPS